jgi:hypothetical protein
MKEERRERERHGRTGRRNGGREEKGNCFLLLHFSN